jgi:hypothetical protein
MESLTPSMVVLEVATLPGRYHSSAPAEAKMGGEMLSPGSYILETIGNHVSRIAEYFPWCYGQGAPSE